MTKARASLYGWSMADLLWAVAIVFGVTFMPLFLGFEFTLAVEGQPNVPLTHHGVREHLPELFQIFLSPSISLGNVLTMLGTLMWVGRWGAKTITTMEALPQELAKLNTRLEVLERQGCFRLDEHRAVIREIRRKDVGGGETEEGDL